MTEGPFLHTTLIQGRLANATCRVAAARANEFGLQILSAPQLAARLAGGLLRVASRESIETGIQAALSDPTKLRDLRPVHDMPGMTRALVRTLRNIWRSGYNLRTSPYQAERRVQDLVYIEDCVRAHLEPGERLLPDICLLARAAIATAPTTIGPLRLEGVHAVDRIWQPLINDLCTSIDVSWDAPPGCESGWFAGKVRPAANMPAAQRGVSCADPAHEALEALRWARELITTGRARPSDIAIAATSTAGWDDYFVALTAASSLPISFLGGRPALAGWDGQRCAALADTLQYGLSQARVRRLLSVAARQGTSLDRLPNTPLPISSEASLSSLDDWSRALAGHEDFASILMPILTVLAEGTRSANGAAELLLRGSSRQLWDEASRRAPSSALMFTLEALRVPDNRSPADSIAWCTADQLAAAPRPFVWLLGLTAANWPRSTGLDPVLPTYVVPSHLVDPDPVEAADRRCLRIITQCGQQVVLSTRRLSAQGTRESPSALMPEVEFSGVLHRDRVPEHALTEGDRLLARPQDILGTALVGRALAAWRDWMGTALTAHDGFISEPQSLVSLLMTQPQSPTSLSLLLRDPLAYVWFYALGWRDLVHKERGLTLPADDFGRLVHELLKRAVDHLEPQPGFAAAQLHQKEEALAIAAAHVIEHWPKHTNVPPPVLWVNTVRQATNMCLTALTFEPFSEEGTRSWTEVPFGGVSRDPVSPIDLPWDHTRPVILPGTDIRIYGIIDRLDLRQGASAVRVTDYKTGQRRKKPAEVILAGGAELQRVMYALACRALLENTPQRSSRLIYLREPVGRFPLPKAEGAIETLTDWAVVARASLEAGAIYPGVKPYRDDPRFGRLAMPAAAESYQERKDAAIRAAAQPALTHFWAQP